MATKADTKEADPAERLIGTLRDTEQLVDTSNQVALNVVQMTTSAIEGRDSTGAD